MDGTIDFIILEHDDVAGCALIAGAVDGVVPAIDGCNTPYVVAKGYDHPTRNWEDCTLFDDIVKAKLAYEGLRGREYSLDGNMCRDGSATSDIRGFTDAELAIEIEKYGACPRPRRQRERQRRILRRPEKVHGPPARERPQAPRIDRSRTEGKSSRAASHGRRSRQGRAGLRWGRVRTRRQETIGPPHRPRQYDWSIEMETVPHVVLEYDKWSDCALVALTDDARSAVRGGTDMPYLVTSGYHRESRTWARATPFGDITRAKVVFEHRVGRDYAPNEGRLHDDEVIACRWRRGDIAGVLEESLDYPIPATKENIDTAIGQIAHVRDRLIEYGWREMVDSIRVERLDLGLGSSQAYNFYRGVYDVTAHHNSMFWPSGDGNAVHVSHCRLGDGPSFGLTVRTIPAAAIVNEPVTFEKIDRLGGKIELCVDGIDADIGKVRAFASSSPVVRAFADPLCAYIPAPSDSVREQERDISPYLRQIAQRCQRISHPIDPPETASAATRATFGGTAAWPVYRGHKN